MPQNVNEFDNEAEGFPPAATENLDGTDEGVQGGFTEQASRKDQVLEDAHRIYEQYLQEAKERVGGVVDRGEVIYKDREGLFDRVKTKLRRFF